MTEFFRGWRKKVGVVTLLMACVAMAGWMRSSAIQDTFTIGIGSSNQIKLISASHSLVVAKMSIKGDLSLSKIFWLSEEARADSWDLIFLFPDLSRAIMTNAVSSDICKFGNSAIGSDDNGGTVIWCQFPYWFVITPLTLISLWLLLSKPLPSTQMKITEPTANEGT